MGLWSQHEIKQSLWKLLTFCVCSLETPLRVGACHVATSRDTGGRAEVWALEGLGESSPISWTHGRGAIMGPSPMGQQENQGH